MTDFTPAARSGLGRRTFLKGAGLGLAAASMPLGARIWAQTGKVLRGSLKTDIEAKVFNAAPGDLLGPFPSQDRTFFEIFMVSAKHPAMLDAEVAAEVRRLLREDWLMARAQEHVIEAR